MIEIISEHPILSFIGLALALLLVAGVYNFFFEGDGKDFNDRDIFETGLDGDKAESRVKEILDYRDSQKAAK